MYKLIIAFFILAISCTENHRTTQTKSTTNSKKTTAKEYKINLTLVNKGTLKVGDILGFQYKHKLKQNPDSIKLTIGNKAVETYLSDSLQWHSKSAKAGKQKLAFTFYWGDTIQQTKNISFVLLSDITPTNYSYKVIKTWPHSTKAYTQGLEFSDGYLYEGTGQYGESMLTKVDLKTNELVQSINLPKEVFGEGITVMNDKIYQITWKSSIGYVYDKTNLNKLYEFNYPTDGWGLTNNGTELIMSDGSETIYFLDKEYFSELRRIEVYDEQGPILNLNELELINDLIYANIYGTNNIVAFDPETGKVIKTINLTGILKKEDIKTKVDVLNGIAWNAANKQLVVTGKWWPKLYHIELVENN